MCPGHRCFGLALLLVLLLSGCEENCSDTDWSLTETSVDSLLGAPESISIGDRTYVLEADLWRDFMPTLGASTSECLGGPLAVVVEAVTTDPAGVSPTLEMDWVWVIREPEARETELGPVAGGGPEQLMRRALGSGPRWQTGIRVHVVVRLRDESGEMLLRASDQLIVRTE